MEPGGGGEDTRDTFGANTAEPGAAASKPSGG